MSKYGMVIDLNKCIRCRTCMVACKIQNNIPPLQRGRVEHYRIRPVQWEEGDYPDLRRLFIPVLCMHCDDPECLASCPAEAIVKRKDGLVVVDKNKCVACGTCAEACPYGVPYLLEKADKCDFCAATRLDQGQSEPYCAKSCVGDAIIFGDLEEPSSRVSRLVAAGKARPLCPEFGTKPNVYYIPPTWYEAEWAHLSKNKAFLEALAARAKDLAAPKSAAAESVRQAMKMTGFLNFPLGAVLVGAVGLDRLAKRKQRVAAEEEECSQGDPN